ncbi:Mth938-like domain-containing protein [Bergeriella denitrificans]|uniref:Protein of uncharacterized function (DUF498/DUF598) n=1 Tax=Bergeriella denitrificans TaxID=494 RepID=A0A378UE70_BERDE|nr:Mth938-like domain-containing protein [Bergeriella denitrificans]STZ75718.1 Protein of uncharacterised function (DUF498/DUF598) [Bergeriella denitrificans]
MLIEEHAPAGAELGAYAPGCIEIGGRVYTEAVVWRPEGVSRAAAETPADLTAVDLLYSEGGALPEVVIVGTGAKQQFLHPKIAAALAAEGVGLECMRTDAACRTLLLLRGEGRSVWAWLWP